MDDIMREKFNIGPTLNFNERLYRQSLNKKFGTHKQIYDLQCLEKRKNQYFPKTKGLIILKLLKIIIRNLVCSEGLHY